MLSLSPFQEHFFPLSDPDFKTEDLNVSFLKVIFLFLPLPSFLLFPPLPPFVSFPGE